MMTAEQLKGSILQLAMQGKLVEQRPDDGTGEELFKEIQTEKKRLLKEGTLKKQKPLPEITEEEKPFEIPESWIWVKLGDISSYAQPKEKVSPKDITPEMWSLDLEDIEKGTGKVLNHVLARERKIQGDKVRFKKGNILYSKLRPYLLKILIADNEGITTPELVPFNIYGIKNSNFFLWYLRSPYVDNAVNSVSYGVKMPRVGTDTMVNLLVPLPPLAEQKRIVAKIEELMPFVEQYAVASTKLNTLNASFPEMMKKSILQEAVQGKLVPQDSNDEPASLLLKKIAEEKKHVKGKRNKSNKNNVTPLEIKDDEKIFDVPASWMWVRAGCLFDYVNGVAFKSGDYVDSSDVLNCRMSNIRPNGYFDPEYRKTYLPNDFYEKYSEFRVFDGDILVALTDMATEHPKILGLPTIVHTNGHKMLLNQRVLKIMPYNEEITEYLNCILQYMCVIHFRSKLKGGGSVQINLKTKDITELAIPLPPLAEQKRIVKKAKELIQLADKMTQFFEL